MHSKQTVAAKARQNAHADLIACVHLAADRAIKQGVPKQLVFNAALRGMGLNRT